MEIQIGQLWESKDTGNRFRVTGLTLGNGPQDGKVSVMREAAPGRKLPKWEDGKYVFNPSAFLPLQLIEHARGGMPAETAANCRAAEGC
jgi:hypothetical protein